MALLIAQEYGKLEEVNLFSKKIAGADYNVSIGLNRLGHQALFITKLGENDPFGTYIYETMKKKDLTLHRLHLTLFTEQELC